MFKNAMFTLNKIYAIIALWLLILRHFGFVSVHKIVGTVQRHIPIAREGKCSKILIEVWNISFSTMLVQRYECGCSYTRHCVRSINSCVVHLYLCWFFTKILQCLKSWAWHNGKHALPPSRSALIPLSPISTYFCAYSWLLCLCRLFLGINNMEVLMVIDSPLSQFPPQDVTPHK